MGVSCEWLDWRSGSYYCRKMDKSVSKETRRDYCENGMKYRDCPNMRSQSSGFCYLTTACVEHKGLADDCLELESMRKLRDEYMMSFKQGCMDIKDYYEKAPKILKAINKTDAPGSIYDQIYGNVIMPCTKLVNDGNMHEAYTVYRKAVDILEEEYL